MEQLGVAEALEKERQSECASDGEQTRGGGSLEAPSPPHRVQPQHNQNQGIKPPGFPQATGASAGPTVAAASGAALVSPHPAPVSIRPGSSTSRQPDHLHISHSCSKPELHVDSHLHAPDPDLPFRGDLAGSHQSPSQPQPFNLRPETGTQAQDKAKSSKMIFADLYKSPKSPLSRLRHPHQPILVPDSIDYDADLVSKDKSKQKEAVKRHLQARVRNDWAFIWPPKTSEISNHDSRPQLSGAQHEVSKETKESQRGDSEVERTAVEEDETALDSGEEPESDSDARSVYSTVSDDPLHWRPRLEWSSELSDDELPYNSPSPFKFDTPDSIGQAVTASKVARQARRRREIRKETAWNEGLACFEARRNAWTGAKVAQIRPKPSSPLSPASPRRALFWRTHSRSLSNSGQTPLSPGSPSPISPSQSQPDAAPFSPSEGDSENSTPNDYLSHKSSRTNSHQGPEALLVETLLPVPPPLLPPANPMRASISPALYNSIYEKVVVNSLQPSCPINLSDMVRACVSGWKRDGEWPPRPAVPEPAAVVAVKRKKSSKPPIVPSNTAHVPAPGRKLSFSFLGGHGRSHDGGDHKMRRESAAGGEDGSGGSGTGPGKAIRRSLQKVLGIGHTMATAADGHIAVQDH